MFGCWFYLTVIEKDAEVELSRFVELPFIPRIGDLILFEEDGDEGDYLAETVKEICYSVADDAFWIQLEIQSISDDEDLRCGCSSPTENCCILRVDWWTGRGWHIHDGPRRGYDRAYYREWMFEPDKWWRTRKDAALP